jgi:hypothetical protein
MRSTTRCVRSAPRDHDMPITPERVLGALRGKDMNA